MEITPTTTRPSETRIRLMRPDGDGWLVIDKRWVAHAPGHKYAGHWGENIIGRVAPGGEAWQALFRGEYDEGHHATPRDAALAIWAAYVEEGRILREQYDYQVAHGWSTD